MDAEIHSLHLIFYINFTQFPVYKHVCQSVWLTNKIYLLVICKQIMAYCEDKTLT